MTRAAIPDPTNPSTVITEDYLVGQQGAHQASYSNHYGSGVPSVTYPCQEYADSATHLMMRVNESNNAQYIIDTLDSSRTIAKTSNYTVTVNDINKTILCDCSSGDLTITLPPASNATSSFRLIIKRIDDSPNKVIVDGYSSQTIDGQLSLNLLCSDEYLNLRCDGTIWYVVGRKTPNPNFLINGALDYWPEDPDLSIVGSGTKYIAGVYKLLNNLPAITLTHSRTERTFGDTLLPDEVRFYSTVTPSGTFSAGNTWSILHYKDDIVQWSGKTITYSIWMNFGSSGSSIVNANAILQYDTVGSGAVSTSTAYQNVVTGWKKYVFTMTLPTLSGHSLLGDPYLQLGINIKSDYEDEVSFALLKCEFSDKATRWVPKSIAESVSEASWYVKTTYPIGSYAGSSSGGAIWGRVRDGSSTEIAFNYSFGKMRKAPNPTAYNPVSGTANQVRRDDGATFNVSSYDIGDSALNFIDVASGLSGGEVIATHLLLDARF